MVKCGSCEDNEATVRCETCDPAILCSGCDTDLHSMTKTKSHVRKPLTAAAAPSPAPAAAAAPATVSGGSGSGKQCDSCEEKSAIVYCETDKQSLCAECDSDLHKLGKSRDHKRTPLSAPPAASAPAVAPTAAAETEEQRKKREKKEAIAASFKADAERKTAQQKAATAAAAATATAATPVSPSDAVEPFKPEPEAAPTPAASAASESSIETAKKPTPPPTVRSIGRTVVSKPKSKDTDTAPPAAATATAAPAPSKVSENRAKLESSLTKAMISGASGPPKKPKPAPSDDDDLHIGSDDDTAKPKPLPSRPAASHHKKPLRPTSAASKSRFVGKFESTKDAGGKKPAPLAPIQSTNSAAAPPAPISASAPAAAAAPPAAAAAAPVAASNTAVTPASSPAAPESGSDSGSAANAAAPAAAAGGSGSGVAPRRLSGSSKGPTDAPSGSDTGRVAVASDASKPAAAPTATQPPVVAASVASTGSGKPPSRPGSQPGSRRPSGSEATTASSKSEDGTTAALEAAAAAKKQQQTKLLDDAKRTEADEAAARQRTRDQELLAASAAASTNRSGGGSPATIKKKSFKPIDSDDDENKAAATKKPRPSVSEKERDNKSKADASPAASGDAPSSDSAALADDVKKPTAAAASTTAKRTAHHKNASISRASFMGGELTEAERRSFLDQFHQFDTDRNGALDRSELIASFKELKYNYSESFYDHLLNVLFPNKLTKPLPPPAPGSIAAATGSTAPPATAGDAKEKPESYSFSVAEYERFMHDFTRIDRQVWEMIDSKWVALTGSSAPYEWNDILHPLVVFNEAGEPDLTYVFDLVTTEIDKIQRKQQRKQQRNTQREAKVAAAIAAGTPVPPEDPEHSDDEAAAAAGGAADTAGDRDVRAAENAVAAKQRERTRIATAAAHVTAAEQKQKTADDAADAEVAAASAGATLSSTAGADAIKAATVQPAGGGVRKVKSDTGRPGAAANTDSEAADAALAAAHASMIRRPSANSQSRRRVLEASQQPSAAELEAAEQELSQADREEDEFIRSEYARFVSAFDRSRDGRASKAEIVKTFKSMGFELTDSKLHEIFHDTNTGNELTLIEFRKIWSAFADHYIAKGFGRAQMEALFFEFDESGDGVVTAAEFKHVVTSLCGRDGLSSADIEQLTKCVDANGDGKIDFDEFLQLLPHPTSAGTGTGGEVPVIDPSTTKAGHALLTRLVRATLPSPLEHIKTLVNMPSNFAASELGPLAARAEHRISRTIRPVLDHTGLRYRNLRLRPGRTGLDTYPPQPVPFFPSKTVTGLDETGALVVTSVAAGDQKQSSAGSGKPLLTAVQPVVCFVIALEECVGIALPKEMEARARIVGRRIHACLYDDKTPVSNVHTVRADWSPEEEDRWVLNSPDSGTGTTTAGPGRHVFVVKTDRPQTTLIMELSVLLRKSNPDPNSPTTEIDSKGSLASPSAAPISAFESVDYSSVTEVSCGRVRYTLVVDELFASGTKKETLTLPVKGIREDEILARRTGFGRVVQIFKGRVTPSIKLVKFGRELVSTSSSSGTASGGGGGGGGGTASGAVYGIDNAACRDAVQYLPYDVITPIHSLHVVKMYRELCKERVLLPAQPLVSGAVSDMALSVLTRVLDMPDALQCLAELWARKYNEMDRRLRPELGSSLDAAANGCTLECRTYFRRCCTFACSIIASAGMHRRHQHTPHSFGGGAAASPVTKRRLTDRAFPPLMIGVNDIWRTEKMRVAMGLTTTPAVTVGGVNNPSAVGDQPSTDPFRSLASDGIGQSAPPDLSSDWKYRDRLPKNERMRLELEFQRFPALMCYEPFDTSELMFDHSALHEPIHWIRTQPPQQQQPTAAK